MRRPRKVKRRLVDFLAHDEDYECALLGALGAMSTKFICKETGLSEGKVTYRLKKAEISRVDTRNGRGPWARMLLAHLQDIGEPNLSQYLRRYSPKPVKR